MTCLSFAHWLLGSCVSHHIVWTLCILMTISWCYGLRIIYPGYCFSFSFGSILYTTLKFPSGFVWPEFKTKTKIFLVPLDLFWGMAWWKDVNGFFLKWLTASFSPFTFWPFFSLLMYVTSSVLCGMGLLLGRQLWAIALSCFRLPFLGITFWHKFVFLSALCVFCSCDKWVWYYPKNTPFCVLLDWIFQEESTCVFGFWAVLFSAHTFSHNSHWHFKLFFSCSQHILHTCFFFLFSAPPLTLFIGTDLGRSSGTVWKQNKRLSCISSLLITASLVSD